TARTRRYSQHVVAGFQDGDVVDTGERRVVGHVDELTLDAAVGVGEQGLGGDGVAADRRDRFGRGVLAGRAVAVLEPGGGAGGCGQLGVTLGVEALTARGGLIGGPAAALLGTGRLARGRAAEHDDDGDDEAEGDDAADAVDGVADARVRRR